MTVRGQRERAKQGLGADTVGCSAGGPTALAKAVALVTKMDGPMGKPCPVCRGGWWFEDDVAIAGVHATECPYANKEPSL